MKNHIRIIKSHLKSILGFKRIFNICIMVVAIFFVKINLFKDCLYINDIIIVYFQGPVNLLDNIKELFVWSIYQLYLIYIVGEYFYQELKIRSIYTIARLGSKAKWNIYNQLVIFIICLIYYLIFIVIVSVCSIILYGVKNFNGYFDIFNIYLVLCLTSFLIITVYMNILIITKRHSLTFILIVLLLYTLVEIGDKFNIDRYILLTQGILSKHIVSHYNFLWPCIYLFVTILINMFIIRLLTVKNDLVSLLE